MPIGPSSRLAKRKIEVTKATLKSQIADLQALALQVEIREAEEASVKSQQMLAERVLKNEPDSLSSLLS